MSPRIGLLAAAALGWLLAACANGTGELGDIKSVKYVEEDLTRWMHLPYASLPPPRFIQVTEEGRYNPSGGEPNLKVKAEYEIVAVNGAFSTMRVRTSGQARRTTTSYKSQMGIHDMGSSYSGDWGENSRRILEVVPGRFLPLSPLVKSRFPELQGVSAAELSHEFTWKIRIGQGAGSERWFRISSLVTDMATTPVIVNDREYLIDAYLIDYSVTNLQNIYKDELKLWYVPVLGWYAQYELRSEGRRGVWRSVGDRISFVVTQEALAEFLKYASPAGT